ncbi:MAG: DegV family protein [Acidimicrobiales bacterium]|jgi:DegV family protein with EDD domain|nr:DegV family protein [Acidimicrobiales bacterium]|tara:strand:+ start:4633 stop:5469 length:837 start_codon:yes stop_codon:yes gene_type:complete
MTVRIVTDSACDLTDDEVASYGIEIVPLSIRFGDEELIDREQLSITEFYARMATSEHLPQTAAPSPGQFDQAFRRALDGGADQVVCVNLSRKVSATMEAAEAGARNIDGDIRVLDSGSVTCGLGTIVLAAAQAASDGASADEITAVVADLSDRTRVYAVLDTLENLKKGGRIGNAKALLGSMLSIKPLLDFSSGEVEEAGKQRTRKKALEWLRSTVTDNADNIDRLAIAHAMADDIDAFVAQVAADTGRNDIRVDVVGPVVASHGGPGLVGVGMVLKA